MQENPYLVKPHLQPMGFCHRCGGFARGLFCDNTCSRAYFGAIRQHAGKLLDESVSKTCPTCERSLKQSDFRAPNGQTRECCSACVENGNYRKIAHQRAGETNKATANAAKALTHMPAFSLAIKDKKYQQLWQGMGMNSNYCPLG